MVNSLSQKFQTCPCLPRDYDRFVIMTTGTKSLKPQNYTDNSWLLIRKSAKSEPLELQFTFNEAGSCGKIHPEGSNIHFSGCVVSNVPVTEPLLELGHQLLESAGLKPGDGQSVSAFVMPEKNGPRVRYYLIDHSARAIKWAEGDDAPSSISAVEPLRARNMLYEEYWVHMENFPSPVPATVEDLRQLEVVLASLAVDASTSDGSTSPFSPTQIQEFLSMLNTFKDTISTFQTYTIARLWCMIWHARVVNNFGTPEVCLDRFTVLSERPPAFTGQYASCAKYFIGADVEAHLTRCSRAWAGRIAYVSEWRSFKTKNELEWTQVMYLACVLIIASLIIRTQSFTKLIPSIALALGCASASNSYFLLSESQNLGIQAADASVHFQVWETAQHGVQGLALRNAAPRALLVWGFLAFILSIF